MGLCCPGREACLKLLSGAVASGGGSGDSPQGPGIGFCPQRSDPNETKEPLLADV